MTAAGLFLSHFSLCELCSSLLGEICEMAKQEAEVLRRAEDQLILFWVQNPTLLPKTLLTHLCVYMSPLS